MRMKEVIDFLVCIFMKNIMLPWNCKPMVTGLLCNTAFDRDMSFPVGAVLTRQNSQLQLLMPVITVLEF